MDNNILAALNEIAEFRAPEWRAADDSDVDFLQDIARAALARAGTAAPTEVLAWAHEDGRVVAASTMESARRDGGAMRSSLSGYTIPLGRIAAPTGQQAEPVALSEARIQEVAEQYDLLSIQDGGRVDFGSLVAFVRDLAAPAAPTAGLTAEIDCLNHRIAVMKNELNMRHSKDTGEVWYWQGDGSDNPASMVNTLTVVINAADFRKALVAPAAAVQPSDLRKALRDLVLDVEAGVLDGDALRDAQILLNCDDEDAATPEQSDTTKGQA